MKFIIYAGLIALFSTGKAEAVIPDLDTEDRIAISSHVVEGTVESSAMITENDALGNRHVYTLTIRVISVLKGENILTGSAIKVTYWQAGKRPHDWDGDSGQRGDFTKGTLYRFFLRATERGFHLHSPNGSEPAKTSFSYSHPE